MDFKTCNVLSTPDSSKMLEESQARQDIEVEHQPSNHGAGDVAKKKIDRPKFNIEGLSVKTSNLSNGLIRLQPVSLVHEPHSATPFLKARKHRECVARDYFGCYERAEHFLDQNGFAIVEPGAETKIRKHIKVVTRTQSLSTETELSSPMVYATSPMLQRIGDSSLLARRTLSRTQSPMLKIGSPLDEISTVATSQQSSPTPLRFSKFPESAQNMQEKLTIIIEENKPHTIPSGFGSPEASLKDKGHTYDVSFGHQGGSPRIDSEDEFFEGERVRFKPSLNLNGFKIEG